MERAYTDMSDQELAGLVREKNPEAFVELSTRYMGMVRARAASFAGANAPDKEDLCQEGFLGLYSAALTYDKEKGSPFSVYAGVCVYNRMVSAVRRRQNMGNRVLNEALPFEVVMDLPSQSEGPEGQYELGESFLGMWQTIEKALTPLELRVLRLYLGGWRRDEIEKGAGMTMRSFDNALHRLRVKLRKL